jgi:adenosine deaminase
MSAGSVGGGVLLHDHLDGGLRPATIIDLAAQVGYTGLPATSPEGLAAWFHRAARGTLTQYLETFEHAGAVMQSARALTRVAFEAAEDCFNDGVVHAEFRFAPTQHTSRGLSVDAVVEATLAGLEAARSRHGITSVLILCAVRPMTDSLEVAKAAVRHRSDGVVGFDLCAAEKGFPHDLHRPACEYARDNDVPITIHAGEDLGPASIALALDCGASRIGHGISVVDDCLWEGDGLLEVGPVAERLLDANTPLEICVTSNLQTKRGDPDQHPLGRLYRAGFNVTINTDNRLVSDTTLSTELDLAARTFGFSDDDMAVMGGNAADAAFPV